ncbi:MAG: hypothetical protein GSR77_07420 [Desulfurococcales archaeon]|nr:hypothetical protein [Desulfurococcales archaeon]
MCEEKIAGCVYTRLSRELPKLVQRYPGGIKRILKTLRQEKYTSHTWQYLKRYIADQIVSCLIDPEASCYRDCIKEIYLADLTGGQHSYYSGHGGKDLDIIIVLDENCKDKINEKSIEKRIEENVYFILQEIFDEDFYKLLGIPNIIEIHLVTGPDCYPYYQMVANRSRSLIKVWEINSNQEARRG